MSALPRWIEVRVLAPIGWHELVADALATGPCTSVAFGRPSLASDAPPDGFDYVRTFFAENFDSPSLRDAITSSIETLADRAGAPELASMRAEFHVLPAEDYASSWKRVWKPFRVGRLCVLPPGDARVLRATDRALWLELGGAFGTGRHATTRECLRVIQARVRPGQRILDAGSGSGILAVAALLCGARSALAFDVDPNAEPYARALAEMNGVQRVCDIRTAGFELLSGRAAEFDGCLANIYSDVVQEQCALLRAVLKPGGWFAFSGCPVHHAPETEAAIRAARFDLQAVRVRGRWHTFVGVRPSEDR